MAGKKPSAAKGAKAITQKAKGRSFALARGDIKTGTQFADFMSALMTDLILGHVTPGIGNAACNAGGKLLKVVEMQLKYGTKKMPLMLNGTDRGG